MSAEENFQKDYFADGFLDSLSYASLEGYYVSAMDNFESHLDKFSVTLSSYMLQESEKILSSFSELEKLQEIEENVSEPRGGYISKPTSKFLCKNNPKGSFVLHEKCSERYFEDKSDSQPRSFHKINLSCQKRKGRPYRFNESVRLLADSNCIPISYRKGIWKAYKTQMASKWCHICNRSSTRANLMPCFNRLYHMCRKSICHYCFNRYYLQESNVPPRMFEKFFCSHCLGICPTNAQCQIYQKTNLRRHFQTLLDKYYDCDST